MLRRESLKDPFAAVASEYATFRPTYPPALFESIADLAPAHHAAWDCATGSGQAARALARHFGRVIASDLSSAQLASARPGARVTYVRARAEAAPFANASCDLVTVAQALHWLDIPAFWQEARRVLVPRGIVAVWCYSLCRISSDIDPIVDDFYKNVVGPFWTPERALTDTGYRTVPFPFDEIEVRTPVMDWKLDLTDFLGYIGTWSAVAAYRRARGEDPVPALRARLAPIWGDVPQLVHFPLHVRAGRV